MTIQAKPINTEMPVIVIVGRPNVGKSALFNRILGRRQAIVHKESGVTRDRIAAVTQWNSREFLLVDTGGLNLFPDETEQGFFDAQIRDQLIAALDGARAAVFVVDVQAGPVPLDAAVAELLRQLQLDVCVAANKADNAVLADSAYDFSRLGFTDILPISSMHGRGIGDLLERVTNSFPEAVPSAAEQVINIAIVGRRNVGKSSTINHLLGEDRVIVSDVPGTTRDAVDVPFAINLEAGSMRANLIDTAGIKRRGKTVSAVEVFSLARARRAIRRADVVIVVIDATDPATAQDKRICRMVLDDGKPCLLLANKWDIACRERKQKELFKLIRDSLPFMSFAPVLSSCAVSGYNFRHILPAIVSIHQQMQTRIPTPLLNRVLQDVTARLPAPLAGGSVFKIFYGVYTGNRPPTFRLFVNNPKNGRDNYLAYLRNQLRQAFGLEGLPIVIELRQRRPDGAARPRKRRALKQR